MTTPTKPETATPDALAKRFHETYERLAPEHGYETRKDSAVPWENVPEKNKALMRAVCAELLPTIELTTLRNGLIEFKNLNHAYFVDQMKEDQAVLDQLRQANAELTAQLSAAREDAGLLDFIQENEMDLVHDQHAGATVWACFKAYPETPVKTGQPFEHYVTARAAIRAAIDAAE